MYNIEYGIKPVVSHDTLSHDVQSVPVTVAASSTKHVDLTSGFAALKTPASELMSLERECKHWEATDLAATHARLYQLLTRAYGYYLAMKQDADKQVRKDYKQALDTFIEQRNYKFLAESDDMHRVVKAVFGSDRRRVSAYSLALKVAMQSGAPTADGKATHVPVTELANWLTEKGGVEEVRREKNKSQSSATPAHETAKAYLEDKVLMNFVPDATTIPLSVEDNDKPMVLVVVYRPNGEFEVKCKVTSDAVVKAAYDAYYKANKDTIDAANKCAAERDTDVLEKQLDKLKG